MAGDRKKVIYGILAVLIFVGLAGAVGYWGKGTDGRKEPSEQYDMVVLGDSILGQCRDETGIPALVAEALDISVYNAAMGGTCMGRRQESNSSSDISDVLSFVSLSRAIVSGDFRLQRLVRLEESSTEYFAEVLEQLDGIDFSRVELLLVGYGANDYHAGERIVPGEDNPYDQYTFIGAMKSALQTLQKTYPDMRIVFMTAPYTWYTEQGLTCEEYVLGGNVLEDYVNAQLETAKELGLEIIDLYHDTFPHETWEDWQKYSLDGLHPNEAGRRLLAGKIIDYLK